MMGKTLSLQVPFQNTCHHLATAFFNSYFALPFISVFTLTDSLEPHGPYVCGDGVIFLFAVEEDT
jgi:hypothetical protein